MPQRCPECGREFKGTTSVECTGNPQTEFQRVHPPVETENVKSEDDETNAKTESDYEDWSAEELRSEVAARDIEGRSELTTKAEFIEALRKDDE